MSVRAEPLIWGQGPRSFEMFLEPTCPFSCKAFGKIDEFLRVAGEKKVSVKVRLQSQPWHMYSPVVTRCVLAASTLKDGKAAARRVLEAVAAHREEFEFEKHAGGANMDVTPRQLIARLEGYSGVKLAEAFAAPDLEKEVKWHARYARQNGIHVSPTFMIDGLVRPEIGSGDPVHEWAAKLG